METAMAFSKLSYILQMQFTSWPQVDQASILGQLLSISRLEMCGRELDGFFQYSWWGLLGAVVNFRFEYSFCVLWFYWIFIQASLKILTRGVPLSHHFNTLSHLFEHSNIVCKFFSIKRCSINWSIPIEERTKKERKQFRFEKRKGLFQLAEYLSLKRIFFFFYFLWRNLRETKDNHGKKFLIKTMKQFVQILILFADGTNETSTTKYKKAFKSCSYLNKLIWISYNS